MEIIAVLVMIAGGIAAAVFALTATAIGKAEQNHGGERASFSRDQLAGSLLYHVLSYGGFPPDEVLRRLRREAGIVAQVVRSIDVTTWAQSYAQVSSPDERRALLGTAVQLAMERSGPIPLRQYCALLDLSFGLGFQTDALARLREQYGFEYVDHAKDARPQEADRAGGATSLFVRDEAVHDPAELLGVLGLTGSPSRQEIISTYRRLVAIHHPDKVADRSPAAQDVAAARFIELTRAYERLLAIFRD